MRPPTMYTPRLLALGGAAVLLTWNPDASAQSTEQPGSADPQAQARVSARPQTGELLELTVCKTSATFDLKLSTKSPTLVELPRGMESYAHPEPTEYTVHREGNKLYLAPPATANKGDEFAVREPPGGQRNPSLACARLESAPHRHHHQGDAGHRACGPLWRVAQCENAVCRVGIRRSGHRLQRSESVVPAHAGDRDSCARPSGPARASRADSRRAEDAPRQPAHDDRGA